MNTLVTILLPLFGIATFAGLRWILNLRQQYKQLQENYRQMALFAMSVYDSSPQSTAAVDPRFTARLLWEAAMSTDMSMADFAERTRKNLLEDLSVRDYFVTSKFERFVVKILNRWPKEKLRRVLHLDRIDTYRYNLLVHFIRSTRGADRLSCDMLEFSPSEERLLPFTKALLASWYDNENPPDEALHRQFLGFFAKKVYELTKEEWNSLDSDERSLVEDSGD